MDLIKQWALTLAVSAAAGAVVLMLAPDGALGKSVRTAVSLFLIVSMLSPFLGGIDFSDFVILPEAEYEQPDLTDTAAKLTEKAVREKISAILSECGINGAEISIDISTEGENISVDGIRIAAESGDFETAENRIKAEIGAETEIEVIR